MPLKTFQDFKDIDPLSTLMSTLSKNEGEDTILIQLLLANNFGLLSTNRGLSNEQLELHPQQQLIKQKMEQRQLKAAFKIAVITDDQKKSKLLLGNIAAAYQATSKSESNELLLKKRRLCKKSFLKSMKQRSFCVSPNLSLSVDELATLYHFPSQKLSNIKNISWGKRILGEAQKIYQ